MILRSLNIILLTTFVISFQWNNKINVKLKSPDKLSSYQIYSTNREKSTNEIVEDTRKAILSIIEDSWLKVCLLIPQQALVICQDELREATSLLVLASIRKSAFVNPVSRNIIELMFEEADQNNDGQVSFVEWFSFL